MFIIGVDYHPDFQQVAWTDSETGECGERRLRISDGAQSVACLRVLCAGRRVVDSEPRRTSS